MWNVSVHKSIIACSDYNANLFIATMLNNILIQACSDWFSELGWRNMCYFGPAVIDANVR